MIEFEWRKLIRGITIFIITFFIMGCSDNSVSQKQPNIIVIIVDDLAYTDLGVFGGEIGTPNLDKLANKGIKLSNYYVAPTCSPTRAMLLSGVDNHLAGMGTMHNEQSDNQKGRPGYEGYLNFQVAALPNILKDNNYHTYMTGKWHLGYERITALQLEALIDRTHYYREERDTSIICCQFLAPIKRPIEKME